MDLCLRIQYQPVSKQAQSIVMLYPQPLASLHYHSTKNKPPS